MNTPQTAPLVYSNSFVECHCLLSSVTAELCSCSWDPEASNIYCLSPFRKSLPIPGIRFLQSYLTMPISRSVHLSVSDIPIVGTCQGNGQRCRFRFYRYTKMFIAELFNKIYMSKNREVVKKNMINLFDRIIYAIKNYNINIHSYWQILEIVSSEKYTFQSVIYRMSPFFKTNMSTLHLSMHTKLKGHTLKYANTYYLWKLELFQVILSIFSKLSSKNM